MKRAFINRDVEHLKILAEQGDAGAQYQLGYALSCGESAEEDCKLAMYWFMQAALQGHPKGLWKVGCSYEHEHPKQAVIWYRKSAEAGYSAAQWWLGVKYQRGEGVEQDIQQALYWHQKAAEQGEACACESLGKMYETGECVEQDLQQSACWYKEAAIRYSSLLHEKL